MKCRGVRGATTATENSGEEIVAATRELLERMAAINGIAVDDIASVIFTVTPDLDTAYPARAAREMGWAHTPLLCLQEMRVAGSLPSCIRVLVLWNTDLPAPAIRHVYLREASILRPDLTKEES